VTTSHLYEQIAEAIRQEILTGKLKPGDRLPPLREMAVRWRCTVGTVQRAYADLAQQGLVVSRAGQGTHVIGQGSPLTGQTFTGESPALRRANLVHRAEAFLLETLTAGHTPAEVEEALRQALERWRTSEQEPAPTIGNVLRFCGSHDPFVAWIGSHFGEIAPSYSLELSFSGSLGGLIALARGEAELAGCHLWDVESEIYNLPFVKRMLPGKRMALVTLAERALGLIVPQGNPAEVSGLKDLERPELRFANRQAGSGSRVWLDVQLKKAGVRYGSIRGYSNEYQTHTEVARAVVEGQVDVGLGLEAAAQGFELGFVPLTRERYELVIPATNYENAAIQALLSWLGKRAAQHALATFTGYDGKEMGWTNWVEA